jgi:hypothetical protein
MNKPSETPLAQKVIIGLAVAIAAMAAVRGGCRYHLLKTAGLEPAEEPVALKAQPDDEEAEAADLPPEPTPTEPPPWPEVLSTDGCHADNPEVRAWIEALGPFPDMEEAAHIAVADGCLMADAMNTALAQESEKSIQETVDLLIDSLELNGFEVGAVEYTGFSASFEADYTVTAKRIRERDGDEAAQEFIDSGASISSIVVGSPIYDEEGTPFYPGSVYSAFNNFGMEYKANSPEELAQIIFGIMMNG